jgi:protein-L-isoaspartate(D-aspartate) O-methyltransferase
MLQAAAIKAGDRALDVAAGSGYGSALLDVMGAKVVALESDAGAVAAARQLLAGRDGVTVMEGPLAAGAASSAPFDVILVEGAFRVRPDALIGQLADGGRLVGVDAIVGAPQVALYERRGEAVSRRAVCEAAADPLDEFQPAPGFVF